MSSEYFEAQMTKHYEKRTSSYFDRQQKSHAAAAYNRHEPRDQARILRHFKDQIGASVNLALRDKSCCSDDNFLNRFLYATKFECEEAMQLLINYLLFKEHNKIVLQKINIFDEQIQTALRDGNPGVLKQRDRRGRKVITFAAANWDPSKYSQMDVYRALLLSLDKLLENVQNQALGFVIIVDWTNFTFKQSSHLSAKILKLMIEGLQDCLPVKFKGIHFIAQPWYVDLALTVIKPFFKEKIKERLMIHGCNLTNLHSLVSKDILPPDLGGNGPSINALDWYHFLLESSQTAEVPRTYRLIEAAIYSRSPRAAAVITKDDNSNSNNSSNTTEKINDNNNTKNLIDSNSDSFFIS